MYLEASRIDDANDTGICDAAHNAEPKVGRAPGTAPGARCQGRDMFNR